MCEKFMIQISTCHSEFFKLNVIVYITSYLIGRKIKHLRASITGLMLSNSVHMGSQYIWLIKNAISLCLFIRNCIRIVSPISLLYQNCITNQFAIPVQVSSPLSLVVNDRAENLLRVKINNNSTLPSFHNASYFMLGSTNFKTFNQYVYLPQRKTKISKHHHSKHNINIPGMDKCRNVFQSVKHSLLKPVEIKQSYTVCKTFFTETC